MYKATVGNGLFQRPSSSARPDPAASHYNRGLILGDFRRTGNGAYPDRSVRQWQGI
ncbi:hypothetical protein Rmet_6544 [Cupriavidus metallidurans CH34]|uniref:Uncharacterized protein n=1 Tax=Cupriavidus metallidurans (strain ATCC 43123 / DSM 2839 / NBRC 102507 / CH34) TaxID=266264 RepID=D3DXY1_CUPMC|nr:hypothetical protein Rmet_6544 [Cupriavidus metallidurans CH34]